MPPRHVASPIELRQVKAHRYAEATVLTLDGRAEECRERVDFLGGVSLIRAESVLEGLGHGPARSRSTSGNAETVRAELSKLMGIRGTSPLDMGLDIAARGGVKSRGNNRL